MVYVFVDLTVVEWVRQRYNLILRVSEYIYFPPRKFDARLVFCYSTLTVDCILN